MQVEAVGYTFTLLKFRVHMKLNPVGGIRLVPVKNERQSLRSYILSLSSSTVIPPRHIHVYNY